MPAYAAKVANIHSKVASSVSQHLISLAARGDIIEVVGVAIIPDGFFPINTGGPNRLQSAGAMMYAALRRMGFELA